MIEIHYESKDKSEDEDGIPVLKVRYDFDSKTENEDSTDGSHLLQTKPITKQKE